ncbi:hypothetical protein Tco_0571642 [Tanacetum coccineum]
MAVSKAEDGDYTQQTLLEYEAEYGVSFTLTHFREELKDCEKWKRVEIPYFKASRLEKNKRYKDRAKKKGAASSASSAFGNEEALARLMVNEYVGLKASYKERKSHNVEALLEIRMNELEKA